MAAAHNFHGPIYGTLCTGGDTEFHTQGFHIILFTQSHKKIILQLYFLYKCCMYVIINK